MRLINFLSITEARPKNISSYEAAVMIAKDDDLFSTVAAYTGNIDVWDNHPRDLAKFIAILNLIKPYNQRLYRGERGYYEQRDGTTHYYETNYPFTSWSLNKDTARDFVEGGIMSYTDGPIKAVSLSDVALARKRMNPGESHYSGMQEEYFVLEPVPRANVWDLRENHSQLGEMFPETNGQNVTGNKLMESMNFSPSSEKPHKEYGTIWSSVFPNEWTDELDRENVDWDRYHGGDYEYEPPQNPEFRPDLDLNLSNANMAYIMRDVLGFDSEEHGFHVSIDNFLTKAQIWLQKNMGQTTPELPSQEEPRDFKRSVTTDPETGVPAISGGHVGPRMISGGRREGYDENNIMRMIKIASLGKEMGATHVSAF